ncbi:hypothetical protein WDV91_12495 [Curtobacterium flaccumfaciens pv. flaccumfaciens]
MSTSPSPSFPATSAAVRSAGATITAPAETGSTNADLLAAAPRAAARQRRRDPAPDRGSGPARPDLDRSGR